MSDSAFGVSRVNLIVALQEEARPLIDHFSLRPSEAVPGLFEAEEVALLVSGVGRARAASSVGLAAGLAAGGSVADGTVPRDRAWLNVGVAGGARSRDRELEVGQGLLASAVIDQASGRRWHPPLVFALRSASGAPIQLSTLRTVDRVCEDYPENGIYDMEAAGFLEAALQFSTAELIQVFKVVSDTPQSPARELDGEQVAELVRSHLDTVAQLASALGRLVEELERARTVDSVGFAESWHFTSTQSHQLKRLLQRLLALGGDAAGALERHRSAGNAHAVIARLEREIESLPIRLRSTATGTSERVS